MVPGQTLSPKVTPSSGGYATGGGNSLSWTMGEIFTATLTGGSSKLSQGEQQPEVQILTGTVAVTSACAGSTALVPYTAYGIIGSNNVFTAQLSDASGNFANPVNIGTLTGNSSGTISVTIPSATPGGSGYRVRVRSSLPAFNGRDNGSNIAISVGAPTGTAGTITGPSAACNGTISLISVNAISGTNVQYSWNTGTNSSVVKYSASISGPFVNGPFQTTTNSVYAQFGTLAGSSGYNVCVQGVNDCGSTNNKCDWIRGVVSVPGTITPAAGAVACPNEVKSFSCGISGGATVYNWTLAGSPTPVTSGQGTQNVQVTFPPAFTSGQLCVTASLSCGGSSTSAPRCMTISKNPAVPGVFTSGPSNVCPGSTGIVYTVPAVTGATGYNWTTPVGTTIASGQNTTSITVNFPNPYTGAPPVCVSALSTCGTSVARCKTVGSNIPSQPGSVTGPTTNVCNSTVQYSISNVAEASGYTWTNPAGTTIASGQGSPSVLLNVSSAFTSGYLTVTANSSLCTPGTSIPRTITIYGKPNTPISVTANPGSWCNDGYVNFSAPVVTPLPIYNWVVTNGTIQAGQGSNNIDVQWGTGTGTVKVSASNGCGAGSQLIQSFTTFCREEEDELSVISNALSVYPNPAHDKITVSIDASEKSVFSIKLIDISGRLVLDEAREGNVGVNLYELDLSHFSKGAYMLKVSSESINKNMKVAIE